MSESAYSRLIVCASIPYMEDRVRLNKLKEVFDSNKIKFSFWGWWRSGDKSKKDYPVKHLWSGGGFSSKKLFLHYPIWILMVFIHSFKLKKNDLIYAVSLDVALPIYLGSKIKKYSYIFDNPDNFSLTYNLKGLSKKIIDKFETTVAKNALYHILPNDKRFKEDHDNIVILPNFPLDSELKRAQNIYNDGLLDGFNLNNIKNDKRFKIYINGRMVYHRGSEWIAEVFEKLDPEQFLIIVAGNIYCDKLKTSLKGLPNVISFPRLVNYKALSLYYYADLVFAFYDPVLHINRLAAPNKWWDCVACQTPFASNSEVETVKIFKDAHACFTIPYGDNEKLIQLLNDLNSNRDKLNRVKEHLEKFEIYSWGEKINTLLKNISI